MKFKPFKSGFFSRKNKRYQSKAENALLNELDKIKSYLDLPRPLFDEYLEACQKNDYWKIYELDEPKVSVCIATYNRSQLLLERSVRSILAQTYKNFELIVVGDACTDETESEIKKIKDSRLKFINLPERGVYPPKAPFRWLVAGTAPANQALLLAKGDFITHLDDDDEHLPNRLELLVKFAKQTRSEFIWHPFLYEKTIDEWFENSAMNFMSGQVTTSSVFYHNWFKAIKWDIDAWRLHEPGDWNRFRKFKYLNIKAERFDQPLLKHYKERNQKNG